MNSFEEKCRRLYETRLLEYTARTDEQLSEYENQLLEAGGQLASEKIRFESRVRRLRLACHQWKTEFQSEIHMKYKDLVSVMESKYLQEVERLLGSLSEAHNQLNRAQQSLLIKEKEIIELKKQSSKGNNNIANNSVPMSSRLESLLKLWNGLNTPSDERVQILAALLDCAQPTQELIRRYEDVQMKLTSKLPIMQVRL